MKSIIAVLLFGFVLFNGSVLAADINYYGIIKSQSYFQDPTNPPGLLASNAFMFNAFAYANSNNVITSATVRLLAGGMQTRSLLPETNDMVWRFTDYFNSSSELESAYPSGSISPVNYAFTTGTINDGLRTNNLDFIYLFVPLTYPSVPQISNLVAGQTIDTTTDYILSWTPLGGGALDLFVVQLTILDMASNVVFLSPVPFSSNALTRASTSISIPANTFPPGTNLQAHLSVGKADVPNTSYATGIAALGCDTLFPLATRPLPAAPRLTIVDKTRDTISMNFPTEPSRLYRLQWSETLMNWTDLLVTNSTMRSITYTDRPPSGALARFYRVKIGS